MRLKDKVSIVTGGARGIGRSIALDFAQEGANVAVVDINMGGAETVVREVRELGRDGLALNVDISNPDQVSEMIHAVLDRWGKLDILVNNAVYVKYIPFLEFPKEEWDSMIHINLGGYFICSQKAAKEMVKRRYGKIINIASMAAHIANHGSAAYAAAKAGIIALTRVMAIELGQYHIHVNAISPGPIETPLVRQVVSEEEIRERIERIPVGRMGKPEDIAKAASFLASDDSSYITGHVLCVEGGFLSAGIMPKA